MHPRNKEPFDYATREWIDDVKVVDNIAITIVSAIMLTVLFLTFIVIFFIS